MKEIFISYRRSDSNELVGRLCDHLIKRYGKRAVFRDVLAISPGENFDEAISNALEDTIIFIPIIGDDWLTVTDQNGTRRLDSETDFVRREIKFALDNERRIVPMLIQDASIPKKEELPESLAELTDWNALELRDDPDFGNDLKRLYETIDPHLPFSKLRLLLNGYLEILQEASHFLAALLDSLRRRPFIFCGLMLLITSFFLSRYFVYSRPSDTVHQYFNELGTHQLDSAWDRFDDRLRKKYWKKIETFKKSYATFASPPDLEVIFEGKTWNPIGTWLSDKRTYQVRYSVEERFTREDLEPDIQWQNRLWLQIQHRNEYPQLMNGSLPSDRKYLTLNRYFDELWELNLIEGEWRIARIERKIQGLKD